MRTANRFFNLIVAISIALGLVMLPAPQHTVQAASDLRISQVYGGNSNASSPYKYDYIELYNAGSSAVSLTGYSVQYASATGSSWSVTSLSGSVAAGGYYLVQEASGTGIADLPTPDATGTINLSGTNGKVALVSSTTALTGTNPSGGSLVDLVGFGTANGFEGTAAAPAPSTTTSIFRKLNGCTDTDNNSADFETGAPAPRNSASATHTCSGNQLPSVLSSVPANNATNVAADATLTVVFSEPVTLAADWFSLTCGGSPVAFTEDATGAPTYVMTPTSGLPLAANCTATVSAAKVTDADGAAMSGDYVINFATVGACPVPTNLQEIHTVQGTGATSPLVGQVVTVRGIVTADFQTSAGMSGFFLQSDPSNADADPATSEGILIYDGGSPAVDVAVGDAVQVKGTVTEYKEMTEIGTVTSVAKCGTPAVIAPVQITLPVPAGSTLEPYEGMLVQIDQPLTVTQNYWQGRYGQLNLSAGGRLFNPTNGNEAGTYADLSDANLRRMIMLDDGKSVQNPNPVPYYTYGNPSGVNYFPRSGDLTSGSLVGVLDHGLITSNSTAPIHYRLHPVAPVAFTSGNPRSGPPATTGSLKVVGFNVLNYFTTLNSRGANTSVEFTRQKDKIVAALAALNADVYGLIELESDPAAGAVDDLVASLNAVVGAGTYAKVADPASGVGTDVIKVGFIYKPATVELVGASMSSTAAIFKRAPVAQTFKEKATGAEFTAVVNHFKSKGCDGATGLDADQGDGQGCWNATRIEEAEALLDFIDDIVTTSGDPDVLVLGDLNSYNAEDPIDVLEAGGLVNHADSIPAANRYSYIFDGAAGNLDHMLSTASLATQVTSAAFWHINTDEPVFIDYNTEFKPTIDPYAPDAYRSSDHDPAVVGLTLAPPALAPTSLKLSRLLFFKYALPGTVVGTLTAKDPNPGETFTYSLAPGGYDNARFAVQDNKLVLATTFRYEKRPYYYVRLRVTDSTGLSLDLNVRLTMVKFALR
ncbi:ExeM/NucH family extracellular endonuclease [Levilinea saccharolytica]|uniref:ExeM/NucH family extracellular endonuclease n=1 Tax=Levilinea saccharolytica TaxID=229921 RepID=UPI0007817D0A|nr:ExeM/NucH family extracellular endonuclease [Levilinea saccharolytica]GAP16367.1 predicted extracellular nuclease [Levilinea saccharolytica]